MKKRYIKVEDWYLIISATFITGLSIGIIYQSIISFKGIMEFISIVLAVMFSLIVWLTVFGKTNL